NPNIEPTEQIDSKRGRAGHISKITRACAAEAKVLNRATRHEEDPIRSELHSEGGRPGNDGVPRHRRLQQRAPAHPPQRISELGRRKGWHRRRYPDAL